MPSVFKVHYRCKKTGRRLKSKNWYGQYVDEHDRTVRVSLGTPDKSAAIAKLAELVKEVQRRRDYGAAPADRHRKTPLAEHLAAWELYLADGGASARHARVTATRARKALAGFAFVREIDPVQVSRTVASITFGDVNPRPLADQTRNYYVRDAKAFTRWLLEHDRADRDWLARLKLPRVRQRRHLRRALAAADLRRLLETTRASGRSSARFSGEDRWALYLTAMTTGFRVGELASLSPASFDFAADKDRMRAARAKNGRAAAQDVPADLATFLGPYLEGRPVNSPLWPGVWWKRAAEMLRPDLEAAGIPYVVESDDGPRFADFHALRHSYITLLSRHVRNPKTVQQLARHSSPLLTLALYTHVGDDDRRAAVNGIPVLGSVGPACTTIALNPATSGAVPRAPDRIKPPEESDANCVLNAKNVLALWPDGEEAPPGLEPGMVDLQSPTAAAQNSMAANGLGNAIDALALALAQLGLPPPVRDVILALARQAQQPPGQGRAA